MADSPTPYRLAEIKPCPASSWMTGCDMFSPWGRCDGCQRDGTRAVLTDRVFVDPIERADVQAAINLERMQWVGRSLEVLNSFDRLLAQLETP